jgi:hypothetical protein
VSSWAFLLAGAGRIAVQALRGNPPRVTWAVVALIAALIGFLLAWASADQADRRMSDAFSLFWQQNQRKLREALKRSRANARDEGMGG